MSTPRGFTALLEGAARMLVRVAVIAGAAAFAAPVGRVLVSAARTPRRAFEEPVAPSGVTDPGRPVREDEPAAVGGPAESLLGPEAPAPTAAELADLAVPDGAEPFRLPAGAMPRGDSAARMVAFACKSPAWETAEFVRRRMADLGWRPDTSFTPPGGADPNLHPAFVRAGLRCWTRIERRPDGGCLLFHLRLEAKSVGG